jgi:hypothetical protein
MIIENFRDLKRGDRVTFIGSNGIEYRNLLLTRECLVGWIAVGSVGQQYTVTERKFISGKRHSLRE